MAKRARRRAPAADEPIEMFEDVKAEMADTNFEWLANRSGVSQPTLYNWHNGKTKRPQLGTFLKVAKALGFEVHLVKAGIFKKKARNTRRVRA